MAAPYPMKAIVFDFGNVIGFFDHRRATDRLAKFSDLSSEAIFAAMLGGQLEDDFESGRMSVDEFVRELCRRARVRCSAREAADICKDIFWPNQDLIALLPRLQKRHRILLGSNTNALHAEQFRRQFADVFRFFDHLVLSHEIGTRKPKAGFFEHCQRLAGCAPPECVFIDDLSANVAGAEACGWHGIVYRGVDDLCQRLGGIGIWTSEEHAA